MVSEPRASLWACEANQQNQMIFPIGKNKDDPTGSLEFYQRLQRNERDRRCLPQYFCFFFLLLYLLLPHVFIHTVCDVIHFHAVPDFSGHLFPFKTFRSDSCSVHFLFEKIEKISKLHSPGHLFEHENHEEFSNAQT